MKNKEIILNDKQSKIFILSIFPIIVAIEYIFTYFSAAYGVLLCLLSTVIIYIIVSLTKMERIYINAAESLALIPLYVLFTSTLPWFFVNQQFVLPAVYAIILALCTWHIYQQNLTAADIGLKKNNLLKYILLGTLIGLCTGPIEYLVLKPAPTYPVFELKYLIRDLLYMTFFVGVAEEILFRGIIQNDLVNIFGKIPAIIGQAFLFGVMHMTWRSPLEIIFTFFAGLLFGILYTKTDSLTAPIVFHGVNNTVLVAVLPYIFINLF